MDIFGGFLPQSLSTRSLWEFSTTSLSTILHPSLELQKIISFSSSRHLQIGVLNDCETSHIKSNRVSCVHLDFSFPVSLFTQVNMASSTYSTSETFLRFISTDGLEQIKLGISFCIFLITINLRF